MKIYLPSDIQKKLYDSLFKAGSNEIGGILMGEHISYNEFRICEISIAKGSSVSFFERMLSHAIKTLNAFYKKTMNNYTKYNYLGEWHSHPLFAPVPSIKDVKTMLEIVTDKSVGANFAVLLIMKLNQSKSIELTATCFTCNQEFFQCDVECE